MSSSSLPPATADLPPAITKYLLSLTLQAQRLAYLQVTVDGRVVSGGQQLTDYGLSAAQPGDLVSNQLLCLVGFFPCESVPEVMPSVHLSDEAIVDIHIFASSTTDCSQPTHSDYSRSGPIHSRPSDYLWILLIDSSEKNQQQQQLQQKANELRLLQQAYRKLTRYPSAVPTIHTMESRLLNQILLTLDILVLELTAERQLEVLSQVPEWVASAFEWLPKETSSQTVSFDPELFSPFLSNFLVDAETFWQEASPDDAGDLSNDDISRETLRSGIWTETRQTEEIHLEAIALCIGQRKIILLDASDSARSEKLRLLQTVREEQLNLASQQKENSQKIFNATFYDTLTGIPNRRLFTAELNTFFEESQWRRDRFFAVVVINIDRFQSLNNSLGTKAGDQVLITVANRICDCLRKPDIPVRFGSDEFGILLSQVDEVKDVTSIVSRILKVISQPFLIDRHPVTFTASAGIALGEDWYQNSRDLLRDATLALQQAKLHGRGQYALFDREMRTRAFELWSLESALRSAIEREQLQLCYQPIISLDTRKIQRFEALIRWQHPVKGWIAPNRFIPLAEESGLIVDLDSWVFKTACQTIRQWQTTTGHRACINVNVSARHFTEGDLLGSMRKAMLPAQVPPSSLCLEITESSLLADPKSVVTTLNQLKALGIDIAIDDFGTGYASLSYLQDLPLDVLKIDGYFIKMMENNSSEIVRTIISLGHKLGLTVTAEQVETLSQYQELKRLECDTVQGYLLSQPLPLLDAQNLLNAEVIISQ